MKLSSSASTQHNSFHVFLKSPFAAVLAALGLGLKTFNSVWLQWSPDNVALRVEIIVNLLHGHVYHGYQAIYRHCARMTMCQEYFSSVRERNNEPWPQD